MPNKRENGHRFSHCAFVCALDDVSWIAVSGADARAFLQAQLTSDVDVMRPMSSQLSAWCSAKGRVLVTLQLLCIEPDRFLLRVPTPLVDSLVKRLRMYVLRAKVEVQLLTSKTIGLCAGEAMLTGTGLPLTLGQIGRCAFDPCAPQWQFKSETATLAHSEDLYAYRTDSDSLRHELLGSEARLEAFLDTRGSLQRRDRKAWTLYDIRATLPYVNERTTDQFVPQMLSLHELNAVSFNKGCYPGQEIVARTQYRGTLKRHLVRLRAPLADLAGLDMSPGTRIYAAPDDAEAAAQIVSAAPDADHWEAIAVIRTESKPRGCLAIHAERGRLIVGTG